MESAARLQALVASLSEEKSRLGAKLEEIELQARAVRLELDRVNSALGALKAKRPRKRKRVGLTVSEVTHRIKSLVDADPSLGGERLREALKESLRAAGRPVAGLGIQLPKALARINGMKPSPGEREGASQT